jgi:hypothetical protein
VRVCLDILTVKDVADDRVLSIYLSSSYIPFEEKGQMSICRLTDKHYHSYSHLLLFPIILSVLPDRTRTEK